MVNKRQKPPSMLQGHRPKPDITVISRDEPPRIIPKCPRGLHIVARKAWKDYWESPLPALLPADMEAIHRYVYAISERELLEEEIRGNPLVPGSQGQMVRNPLFDIMRERTREIEKFREQFGLTPLARMRLGIAYSEADEALDRMQKRRQNLGPVMVEVEAHDRSRHTS